LSTAGTYFGSKVAVLRFREALRSEYYIKVRQPLTLKDFYHNFAADARCVACDN
jgi:hypothetical protein